MHLPRLIIAGLAGGSGKTLVSLGLARAYLRAGKKVKTFKKGPDYIDATFLAHAAMSKKGNLDNYFCTTQGIVELFIQGATNHDLSIIEGNRGLFDGLDSAGSTSTAELASQLHAPIILVLNCQKITRTAAALVLGCTQMEPKTTIAGVILNNIGTKRQQEIITTSIEKYTKVPVLGVVPRQKNFFIQERQGIANILHTQPHTFNGAKTHNNVQLHQHSTQTEYLTTQTECQGIKAGHNSILSTQQLDAQLNALADVITTHVDLDALLTIAKQAPNLLVASGDALAPSDNTQLSRKLFSVKALDSEAKRSITAQKNSIFSGTLAHPVKVSPVTIGYIQDAAFWCYYEENLTALKQTGASLIPLSLLNTNPWPKIHGLYIGGGEPEQYIEQLAVNIDKLTLLRNLFTQNLPIYAESAGLIPLCHTFCMNNQNYSMSGILPASFSLAKRPQGLGYIEGKIIKASAFFPAQLPIKGHEFHFYTHTLQPTSNPCTVALTKGKGLISANNIFFDGFVHNNLFASLFHLYAPSLPHWAPAFTKTALRWKKQT